VSRRVALKISELRGRVLCAWPDILAPHAHNEELP